MHWFNVYLCHSIIYHPNDCWLISRVSINLSATSHALSCKLLKVRPVLFLPGILRFGPKASKEHKQSLGTIIVQLLQNLSELNNCMCGPPNRKGLVCSECADGFGPSVTSFGYKCANCTDHRYGVATTLSVSGVCPNYCFLHYLLIISNLHNISSYALLYHVCPDYGHYFLFCYF